ncbi:uncharacterized protein LOC126268109 [Schistocerca gregaria]|uniref:uncharacterized protein LOC126268109 n=1 Tax=Schistocerca gregaria TaxID=7010 RepID=UPI00211EC814|nr:uncharacterized protein LOC126268109 [Schistocerca gregaria]
MSAIRDRIPLAYRRMPMSLCLYHNVGHEKRMQLRSQRLLLEREALIRRAIVNSSLERSEQGPPFKYKENDEYFDSISGSASDEFSHLHFRTVVRREGKICHSFVLRLHNNDGHEEEEEELINEKEEVTEEHREKKDEEQKAVICMQGRKGEEKEEAGTDCSLVPADRTAEQEGESSCKNLPLGDSTAR